MLNGYSFKDYNITIPGRSLSNSQLVVVVFFACISNFASNDRLSRRQMYPVKFPRVILGWNHSTVKLLSEIL